MRPTLQERLMKFVAKNSETACWEWTGSTTKNGYGRIGVGGHSVQLAHRVSYRLFRGPILKGMEVCHRCDNRRCVNPDHLFVGSRSDNMKDMLEKGRQNFQKFPKLRARGERHGSRTHPERTARGERNGAYTHPEKRPHGEQHGQAKLTTEQVREIRLLGQQGIAQHRIGKMFGVNQRHVGRILAGISWKEN